MRIFIRNLLIVSTTLVFAVRSYSKVIVLPSHIVNGRNMLQQQAFTENNAEYLVKYKFDLDSQTIKLPEGSTLSFSDSGLIGNGTLVGQNSTVKANSKNRIFSKIVITGTWSVPEIYSNWFDFSDNSEWNVTNFKNLCSLTGGQNHSIIYINEGTYPIRFSKDNATCLILKSNTTVVLNGTICLEGNDLPTYRMVYINRLHDVTISGNGRIVGDVVTHTGRTGEWGMGIWIKDSKNIVLKDITVSNCWGDCIYLGQSKTNKDCFSENILIDNVTCSGGRRQGLSIISGKNIRIINSTFTKIGTIKFTRPGHGIDIEPNVMGKAVTEDIVIEKCRFVGNKKSDFSTYNLDDFARISIINCFFGKKVTFSHNTYNVTMDNCEIYKLNCHSAKVKNIIIKNTTVKNIISGDLPQGVRMKNCTIHR